MPDQPTVTVTGATGLIAKYVIAEFLKRGFSVNGTLRRMEKADGVRRAVSKLGGDASKLSFAIADLLDDNGWDAALAGSRIVVHTASPFPIAQPDDPEDVIRPARDGTLRVLKAAIRAGAERLVLTSSTVAIFYGSGLPKDHVYSEADFSDETRSDLTPYIRSKTIAEKAAWNLVKSTPGAPGLTVINPSFVQGPAVDDDLSTSHEIYRLLARGAYPAAPKIYFPITDVRDVAMAHAEAALNPVAVGKRYLIGDGNLGVYELGKIMVREFPEYASKAPKYRLPDVAVRALVLFDKRLRTILPELGQQKSYSNARARSELGLNLHSADAAATAAVRSLRDLNLI